MNVPLLPGDVGLRNRLDSVLSGEGSPVRAEAGNQSQF